MRNLRFYHVGIAAVVVFGVVLSYGLALEVLPIERGQSASPVALAVFGGGILATLLLSLLLWFLARTRSRALDLAACLNVAARESGDLLAAINDNVRDAIYRGAPGKGLVYVNRGLLRMFGYKEQADFFARPMVAHYVDPARYEQLRAKLLAAGRYEDEEVEYRRADGSCFVGLSSERLTRAPDGRVLHYDGVISDITRRKEAERKVCFLAHYDSLTGLPNRTLFGERFRQAAAGAKRGGYQLALLFLDLDHFKDINDSRGHEVGDRVLVEAARRLRDCIRNEDSLIRFGGDEFGVLLGHLEDEDDVRRVVRVIVERLSEPYRIGKLEVHTSPSVGVAFYPRDGADFGALYKNADTAMYQVKHSGRAGYAFYTEQISERARRRSDLELALRQAVEAGEFRLVFQPRVSLKYGRIMAVEALLRWSRPHWGSITPMEFIPAAERTGLIVSLGRWVLAEALAQWRRWSERLGSAPRIGINISTRQLREPGFGAQVRQALSAANVPGEMLEFDLTESTLFEANAELERTLADLRAATVILAFDDFGIGYSNLGNLKRFGINVVKIDQSFVRDINDDPNDASIVRGIISIAQDFGVQPVAEGVETEAQLGWLRRMRCDQIQGFLLARPMSGDAILDFLERWEQQGPTSLFAPRED